MMELFLDGYRAIPSGSVNWKLTAENPYFTKASSYTYEIELPMSIIENREIFGDLHRIDTHKQGRTLSARLVVDNVPVLVGEAKITSISEDAVKVQLLGGESAYNNNGDKYVDELDLSDWGWRTWPDGTWPTYNRSTHSYDWNVLPIDEPMCYTSYSVIERVRMNNPGLNQLSDMQLLRELRLGNFPWVAYPTFNRNSEVRSNAVAYQYHIGIADDQYELQYHAFFRGYEGEKGSSANPHPEPITWAATIQPFLWYMCELVAEATGFSLARADNYLFTNPLLNKIFIVNTDTSALCAKALPHWTVNEFWQQIEQAFGVVVSVDCATASMKLMCRSDYYNQATIINVGDVVDEYYADIDDETEKDISVNNVGYADCDAAPEDILAEEIIKNARFIKDYADLTELLIWARGQEKSVLDDYKDCIFDCRDGRQYIYSTKALDNNPGFIEVNMLRPRIQNEKSEDIEIELKVVPARFAMHDVDLFEYHAPHPTFTYLDVPASTFSAKMIEVEGVRIPHTGESGTLDIQAVLDEEEDTEFSERSKLDKLFIAIADNTLIDSYEVSVEGDGITVSNQLEYPRARIRERKIGTINGEIETEDQGASLSLISIKGQNNLANATIADSLAIQAKARSCIKFIADKFPDPRYIFLIRNKYFVCEKFEVAINNKGFDKLITGYFYELDL